MLRRTRVGPFDLTHSATLEALEESWAVIGIDAAARVAFPTVDLDADHARDVGFGRTLHGLDLGGDSSTALFDPDGRFLALYRQRHGDAVPVAVFA